MEYEAARAELYEDISRGSSIEDIRARLTKKDDKNSKKDFGTSNDDKQKKITKGEIKTKVQKHQETRSYSTQSIQRKKRDLMQLLNKHIPVSVKSVEEKSSMTPKSFSALELYSKLIEEQSDINILNKKTYRVADDELLVGSSNKRPLLLLN